MFDEIDGVIRWIKCSERLPTIKDLVGFVYADNEIYYDTIWFDLCCSKWMEFTETGNYCRCIKKVTHWMEKPKAPVSQ
jgi:hypothetical protein